MIPEYVRNIVSISIPPVAYAALQAEDQWPGSIVVAALFGLDTLYRLGTTTIEPARAIGEDKRKVRRLNGKGDIYVKSYKEVRRPYASLNNIQVKRSPKSRWSILWLVNAILTAYICEHLFFAHPISTKDTLYAR